MEPKKPTLLVVIPTRNHLDYAAAAGRSALAHTIACSPFVLFVDDASPDWPERPHAYFANAMTEPGGDWATDFSYHRFPDWGGLTRSWNFGVQYGHSLNYDYICVANSDLLFAPGWDEPLVRALEGNVRLVGPMTNAPGHEKGQYVGSVWPDYPRSDDSAEIARTQQWLTERCAGETRAARLNGFCMVARSSSWCEGAHTHLPDRTFNAFRPYNARYVTGQKNPDPLNEGNEDELQARWAAFGWESRFCLDSYVFHYRAVTRGAAKVRGDWMRRLQKTGA